MRLLIGHALFVKMSSGSRDCYCESVQKFHLQYSQKTVEYRKGLKGWLSPPECGTPAPTCGTPRWLCIFCALGFQPQDLLTDIPTDTDVTQQHSFIKHTLSWLVSFDGLKIST